MNRFKRTLFGALLTLAAVFFNGCGSGASVGGFGSLLSSEYNLTVGDYAEARRLARAVFARNPKSERALMVVGWSDFKLGNYRSALVAFRKAETLNGGEYSSQSGIAWSYLKLGELDNAEAGFQKAGSAPRHYYEVWDTNDGLGWIAYGRGDLTQAQKFFNWTPHILQGAPNDVAGGFDFGSQKDTWVGRGLIALNQNQLVKAREIFSEGTDKDPDYFRHYDGLARTALLEGRYEEALEYAIEATKRVKYDDGVAFLLDAILEKIGSPERSVRIYADLIGQSPEATGYFAFLGRIQLKIGRLRDAEASFVKALEFNRDDDRVKDDLARAWRQMNEVVANGWTRYFNGDYESALAIFQAKQRQGRRDGNPAAETGRGWALLSSGRVLEAVPAFQAALRIDPNFASAREGLKAAAQPHKTLYAQAWALADAGKFGFAKRQFLRARKRAPDDFQWKTEDGLAWLFLYQKDIGKAEAAFRRVLRKVPGAYLSRKGLGFVALEQGDYSKAAQHLFQSLTQEPKQVLTSYTLPAVGFLAARKFDIARKLLEMGEKAYPRSADIQFLQAKAFKGLNDMRTAAMKAVAAATRAPVYINPAFEELALDPAAVKDAFLALAKGLYFSGDNTGAIKRVNDYIGARGGDLQGLRIRGFALFRLERYKEANADLALAAEREPGGLSPITEVIPGPDNDQTWKIVYDARSTLAWSHLRLGNAREAAHRFRQVLKTHPMWIDTLTGLGYSLLALGDKDGAAGSFRKALIVTAGYPYAWQGMELVKRAQ